MSNIFIFDLIGIGLLISIGLYTLLVSRNVLRMLIGFEIMAKGVTLAIISAGAVNGKIMFAQTMVITAIVVEVVFIAVALAIVMMVQRKHKSLSIRNLTNLKG